MSNTAVKGLILMGGQSLRMGSDKAFVEYRNQTLLKHCLAQLEGLTSEVFLSVNADQFEILHGQFNCIQDHYPDKGPMGGILSALETLNKDLIVLAVDMPEINHEMLSRIVSKGNKVRAYQNQENQWEPLPSFWPKTITKTLYSYFAKDQLSLNGFLKIHGEAVISNVNSDSFKNLNRPSDLI
ncbi:MAG: molybdopterin-guanine dinucleotide biosynthesis protein A [Roseivirga sp.]|jgi:molybdopterin-guanine dinucleotide biosynthesis protein A